MKKKFTYSLVCLGLLALTALASDKPTVIFSPDGRKAIATSPAQARTPYVRDNSDSVIFGNLGGYYPDGVYFCCLGNSIFGPANPVGFPEFWQAAGFTPSTNMTVTKIKVAVGWINYGEKDTDVLLSLNEDNAGTPGKALKTWKLAISSTLFGSCCTVQSKAANIAVTAGSQYWVVLSTEANSDVVASWNFNDVKQLSSEAIPTAYYCASPTQGQCGAYNKKWYAYKTYPGFALEVDGK